MILIFELIVSVYARVCHYVPMCATVCNFKRVEVQILVFNPLEVQMRYKYKRNNHIKKQNKNIKENAKKPYFKGL